MADDMRQALDARRDLIERRADVVLDGALADGSLWVASLDAPPEEPGALAVWRRSARVVAAYRDRYGITGPNIVGARPATDVQAIDWARAEAARLACVPVDADMAHRQQVTPPLRQVHAL